MKKQTQSRDLPVEITIKRPFEIVRQRGLYATGRYGENLKTRVNAIERDKIKQAAALCDVSVANFVRWCATHVADQLLKEVSKDDPGSDAS